MPQIEAANREGIAVSPLALLDARGALLRAEQGLGGVSRFGLDPEVAQLVAECDRLKARLDEGLAIQDRLAPAGRDEAVERDLAAWRSDATDMAGRLGLGRVEIRSDDTSRGLTEAAGSRGVALGGTVHLHPDRVRPGTTDGREVLAHELVHLAQSQLTRVDDGERDVAEHEAASLAPRLAVGEVVGQPRHYIDLARPAGDGHAKKPPRVGPDAIAQAEAMVTEAEELAESIQVGLDLARGIGDVSGMYDPVVDSLGDTLVIAENTALSDPTLPEQRKKRLSALFERIDRLKAGVKRFQLKHHGYSLLLRAEGKTEPAADAGPVPAPVADVSTVKAMQETLVGAIAAATVGHWDRAKELFLPVEDKFLALRYGPKSEEILRSLGTGRTHFELQLDEANAALIALRQEMYWNKAPRLMRLALKRFKVATEILRIFNGEIDASQSKLVSDVEDASSHRLQIALAPALAVMGAAAAPEVLLWAATNPNTALVVLESTVSLAPGIIAAGGPLPFLKQIITDPASLVDFAAALAGAYANYHAGRLADRGGGGVSPVEGEPTAAPAPKASSAVPDEPTGTTKGSTDVQPSTTKAQPENDQTAESVTTATTSTRSARVTSPVPGVYESVDPEAELPSGWVVKDDYLRDGSIRTTITAPNGASGHVQRRYDPATGEWKMIEAFFAEDMPRWIKAGAPLVSDRGTPLIAYLDLRQMKLNGVGYGGMATAKLSTIQNIEAICQLEAGLRRGLALDEAVAATHSVSYAETELVQSGHRIVGVRLEHGQSTPFQDLLEFYEASGFRTPAQHDEILERYGLQRTDVVLWNYDVIIDLAPAGAAQ